LRESLFSFVSRLANELLEIDELGHRSEVVGRKLETKATVFSLRGGGGGMVA